MNALRSKSILHFGLLALFCVFLSTCGGGGGSDIGGGKFSTETEIGIEAAVNRNLELYGSPTRLPGAVVGVWTPHKAYVKGIGKSNLISGSEMTTDLHFRIASITKTFVTTVILQLVDEGKLSLDDAVSKFNLGVSVPDGENITIRELCNMTSGLFELYHSPQFLSAHIPPDSKISPKQLLSFAVANPSYFPPGQKWFYSNTNFLVLGLIVEEVTGNSLSEEISARLIQPLGLSETTFAGDDPAIPDPFAHGYAADEDGNLKDVTLSIPPAAYWGIGNMISTLDDLRVWTKAYVTGTTNGAATQAERLNCNHVSGTNQTFGLSTICSAGWYGFTGGISGYNAAAYYLPESEGTIVVLVNSLSSNPEPGVAMAIVRDIAKIVFPDNVPF